MKFLCVLVVLFGFYRPFMKHELCVFMTNTSVHGVVSYNEADCEELERNTQVCFDNSRHHQNCTNLLPCTFVLRTHYTHRARTFNTLPPCLPLHLNDTGLALSVHNSEQDRQLHETTDGLEKSISGFALRYSIFTTTHSIRHRHFK